MKSIQKGFTLIELMIVVAIIAILAAIAIPAYQDYVIRSQVSEGMTLSDGAKTAVAEYFTNYGDLTDADNAHVGLAGAESITGNYVSQVEVAAGVISATFSKDDPQKANTAIDGAILILSPKTKAGSIAWTCKAGTDLNQKYLPSSCRTSS